MELDWYETARKEFLQDLWTFTETSPEDSAKIYAYLNEVGLIDYDQEKDYLYDNYVDGCD